jgi:hypothetical protein
MVKSRMPMMASTGEGPVAKATTSLTAHNDSPYLMFCLRRCLVLLLMETSMLAFATDLHDEGLDSVLGNVRSGRG